MCGSRNTDPYITVHPVEQLPLEAADLYMRTSDFNKIIDKLAGGRNILLCIVTEFKSHRYVQRTKESVDEDRGFALHFFCVIG